MENTKPELNGRPLGLWLKIKELEQRASEPMALDVDLDSRDDLVREDSRLKSEIEQLMNRRDVDPHKILRIDDEITKLQRRCGAIGRALGNIQQKFSEACDQAAGIDRQVAALRVRLASSRVFNTSSDPSARTDQATINCFVREIEIEGCHESERPGREAKLKAAREALDAAVKEEFGSSIDQLMQSDQEEDRI